MTILSGGRGWAFAAITLAEVAVGIDIPVLNLAVARPALDLPKKLTYSYQK